MRTAVKVALAGAALFLSATPVMGAITVNPDGSATVTSNTVAGSNFTINFDGEENNAVIPGLTSTLKLTFQGLDGNNYLFDYLLTNTSSAPITASVVTAFGFDTDPNVNKANSTVDGVFGVVGSGSMANNTLEICFKNGQNNNCGGSPGNQGVVQGGLPGSGSLKLAFDSFNDQITLSHFLDRYQGINGPGIEGGSAVGFPTTGAVPEPDTWALMLLGFGGIGMALRRSRKQPLLQIA